MSDAMPEARLESHNMREPLKMEFQWLDPVLATKETVQHPYRCALLSSRIFTDPHRNPPSYPTSLGRPDFPQTTSISTPGSNSSATSRDSSASVDTTIQYPILEDARGRHIPKIYTVIADQRRDDLIDAIMASPTVAGTLAKFERRRPRLPEEYIALLVTEVGNKFRAELVKTRGQASESYGMLVSLVDKEDRDRSENDDETRDTHVNRPEVIALDCNVAPGVDHDWSMVTAFIDVKRDWRKDTDSDLAHPISQCLRYCRNILFRSPMRSHLHFVTWCGDLVRLWYVDAAHFGCSAAYSAKKPEHRRDIGRILFLLTSEECRGSLSGRWNPEKDIASHLSNGNRLSGDWTKALQPHHIRPGPFGSRTAIWKRSIEGTPGTDGNGTMHLFLKCSWRPRRLLDHELTMQYATAALPGTPSPIGRPMIPASATGFREETVAVQQDELVLDVLLYKHRLGHPVKSTVREMSLLRLHWQLAEQLFQLSEAGFHYRDLNAGNFLVQDNTDDVLVLADYGNMRRAFGPRGNCAATALDDVVERARDDVRSANPCFLPHVYFESGKASRKWEAVWGTLRRREKSQDPAELSLEYKAQEAERCLLLLRQQLCQMLIYSHRYVDDLESAMYLHVWQAAEKSGISADEIEVLTDTLANETRKFEVWQNHDEWLGLLASNCPKMSPLWETLMTKLRGIICTAQNKLRQELQNEFEQILDIRSLQLRLRRRLAEPNASMEGVVKSLLERPEGFLQNERLHAIEQACFEDVMEELRKAAEASDLQ